jgi:predicted transcriptional regulator
VTTALSLYRGEFLDGLSIQDSPLFEEWLGQRRAYYRQQVERLQMALADAEQPALLVDWGEIPGPGILYGRENELAQVERWLVGDQARLIGIYGIGGQGKTALAAALVRQLAQPSPNRSGRDIPPSPFQRIIWRSLLNAPHLDEILLDWIRFLSDYAVTELPSSLDRKIALLLELLRVRPSLLVLDNLESLLESGTRAGRFRPGYVAYGQLIGRFAQSEHQSCLLITSREQLSDIQPPFQLPAQAHHLFLSGVSAAEGVAILRGQKVQGDVRSLNALSVHYSGNPLALLLAAQAIHDLFVGDADDFLAQDRLIFEDIRDMLDAQIRRLAPLEFDLLLWLAVEREPVSLREMNANLVGSRDPSAVMDTLRSLKRRLLVESDTSPQASAAPVLFGLQNVVLEYLTEWLVATACQELEEGRLHILRSHGLLKAHTRTYVRESQQRLILKPIMTRMAALWGQANLGTRLRPLLDQLRQEDRVKTGYAAANLLHLLLVEGERLEAADFSHLSIQGAYLRNAHLPHVNFAGADLSGSVFTDRIGIIRSVAADPTDAYIAAGSEDGQVWIWHKADQSLHQTIQADTAYIFDIAFSPNGRLLACAGTHGALSLWEVASGRLYKRLQATDSAVKSLAFSPDGACLVSTGSKGEVNLWRIATGEIYRPHGKRDQGSLQSGWSAIGLCHRRPDHTLGVARAEDSILLARRRPGFAVKSGFSSQQGVGGWRLRGWFHLSMEL